MNNFWMWGAFFALFFASVNSRSLFEAAEPDCNCDWRLLRHYEAKNCKPEKDECGCPTKFTCPSDNQVEKKKKVCTYKGKEFAIGSKVNTTNPCQVCRCLGGLKPHIFCANRECPPLNFLPEENCHLIYKRNACCPTALECGVQRMEAREESDSFACEYEDVTYPVGARIYPSNDVCKICNCIQDQNGTVSVSCYQQDCMLEKYRAELDAGCIPIYHENRCCPIEFYCPEIDNSHNLFPSANQSQMELQTENSDQCMFAGKLYDIGEELHTNHPSKCIKCTCSIPPDFTCIHQSCPNPPSNVNNCVTYYSAEHCCPQYECLFGDDTRASSSSDSSEIERRELEDESSEVENQCSGMRCNSGMKCTLFLVLCGNTTCPPVATCLRINNECAVPSCGQGCAVIEQDENNCPICACGDDIYNHASLLKCQKPTCVGENCHFVSDGGCPVCACDQPCEENECPEGCNVISEAEGRCPECVCENDSEGCPTPICADETCRIESPDGGCPTCICGERSNRPLQDATLQRPIYQQRQSEDDMEMEGPEISGIEDDFDNVQFIPRSSETETDSRNTNEVLSGKINRPTTSHTEFGRHP